MRLFFKLKSYFKIKSCALVTRLQVLLKGFAYNVQAIKIICFLLHVITEYEWTSRRIIGSSGNSPICRARQCQGASQTWDYVCIYLGSSVEKDEQIPTEYAKRILLTK
jgi:hypothetical protein